MNTECRYYQGYIEFTPVLSALELAKLTYNINGCEIAFDGAVRIGGIMIPPTKSNGEYSKIKGVPQKTVQVEKTLRSLVSVLAENPERVFTGWAEYIDVDLNLFRVGVQSGDVIRQEGTFITNYETGGGE